MYEACDVGMDLSQDVCCGHVDEIIFLNRHITGPKLNVECVSNLDDSVTIFQAK
jgi:hypothetical protein